MDTEFVVRGKDSIELEDLLSGAEEGLEKSQETLHQWFKRAQTIFYKVINVWNLLDQFVYINQERIFETC